MPLTIRLANLDDAPQIRDIYEPYCFTPISFEITPPDVAQMRQRVQKIQAWYPYLVCELQGEILGYAYAYAHSERAAYCWSVDTSIYVHPQKHRHGLGRALYAELFAILPQLGYVNAYAGVTIPNAGSTGLHEAFGFKPVGIYRRIGYKCGAWHDVIWYYKDLQALPDSPAPPLAIQQLPQAVEWQTRIRTWEP